MSSNKVTLYYADWCGHCKNFKPIWEGLKNVFNENNIKHEEYEESKDEEVMLRENIEAYPTIIIENDSGKYQYNGGRDADSILREFFTMQGGGSKNKKFKIQYSNI